MPEQIDTSWDELGWAVGAGGVRHSRVFVGDAEADVEVPVVVRADYPPGCEVPPHTHDNDYAEVIVDGSISVGKRSFGAGDVRVVRAGTGYGPIVVGPDGCQAIIVFAGRDTSMTPLGSAGERG